MACSFDIQLGNNIIQESLFYPKPGTQEAEIYVIPSGFFLEYNFVVKGYHSREWTKGGLLD